jgi:hypothetical protein
VIWRAKPTPTFDFSILGFEIACSDPDFDFANDMVCSEARASLCAWANDDKTATISTNFSKDNYYEDRCAESPRVHLARRLETSCKIGNDDNFATTPTATSKMIDDWCSQSFGSDKCRYGTFPGAMHEISRALPCRLREPHPQSVTSFVEGSRG